MDVDEDKMNQMTEVWKHILPPEALMTMKRMQEHSNSNPAKKRQRQGRQPQSTKKEDTQNAQMSEVLKMLVQLTLRQENQLKCLSLDHEFILHIGSGEGGILAEMAAQTAQWHGEEKTGPLRWKLAHLVMKTINLRLNQLALCKKGSESWTQMVNAALILEKGDMPFLTWDNKIQKLVPTKQQPLKLAEAQSMMAELEQCFQDQNLVMKFHSLKKATPDHQVQSSPWSLMLSNRCHPVAYQHLMALSWHSIWQLGLIRLKPAGLQQSNLVDQLRKASRALWGQGWMALSKWWEFSWTRMFFATWTQWFKGSHGPHLEQLVWISLSGMMVANWWQQVDLHLFLCNCTSMLASGIFGPTGVCWSMGHINMMRVSS